MFEIENKPEKVKKVLSGLSTDTHLSKTFEGTLRNGDLIGFYTNLALVNGMVIGYVKIKGKYDIDKGVLSLRVIPSNLFWLVIVFFMVSSVLLMYKGIIGGGQSMLGFYVIASFIPLFTIAFLLEKKSFLKHINRVSI